MVSLWLTGRFYPDMRGGRTAAGGPSRPGTGGGTRTRTSKAQGILSPLVRVYRDLPVHPHFRKSALSREVNVLFE